MRLPAHFIDAHESRHEKSHFDASFAEPIPFLGKIRFWVEEMSFKGQSTRLQRAAETPQMRQKNRAFCGSFALLFMADRGEEAERYRFISV